VCQPIDLQLSEVARLVQSLSPAECEEPSAPDLATTTRSQEALRGLWVFDVREVRDMTDSESKPEHAQIPARISREELYELVWAEPAVKVAERFGVSDVAIAKWCKRLGVPRPGRGYWARVEAGQRPAKPPRAGQPAHKPIPDVPGLDAFESPIPVPDVAAGENELVGLTRRALEGARIDDTGFLRPRARKLLDVTVSEASLGRALRILNAVLLAMESAGHAVETCAVRSGEGRRGRHLTFAVVGGEKIPFSLMEKTTKAQREPTARERARMAREYSFRGPFYDYSASGQLSLTIDDGCHRVRVRRTFSDGKRQQLERCLHGFVRSVLLLVQAIKRQRREDEERRVRQEEERIRREEAERRQREEARRRHALENAAFAWTHAERIRRFLNAVEEAVASEAKKAAESEAAFTWC